MLHFVNGTGLRQSYFRLLLDINMSTGISECWRGVVVTASVTYSNEVDLHRARLVLTRVTIRGNAVLMCNQPLRLISLLPSAGRETSTSQRPVTVDCDREANRRSAVVLIMRYVHVLAQRPKEGDEHSAYTLTNTKPICNAPISPSKNKKASIR